MRSPARGRRFPTTDQENQAAILGKQINDRLDPSRFPPRVAICDAHPRTSTIKEIADLLRIRAGIHPEVAHVDLYDPRYIVRPRAYSTLIIKRKPNGPYKAILCTRGDLVPLTDVAFVSAPAARLVCLRLLRDVATAFRRQLKTLDITQSFLQSGNLNDLDRLVIIPAPVIAIP